MNVCALVISFYLCLNSSFEQQLSNEVVEKFIKSSTKTVAIITIDGDVYEGKTSSVQTFMNFNLDSKSLVNCEHLTKVDKYSNSTSLIQLNKFRTSKTFKDFVENANCETCDNVIVTSSLFLDSVLKCFVNSIGTFLIVLTDTRITFSDRDLMNTLSRTWTEQGALKVFISINDNVFSFDPFHRSSNGIFGKLNSFSDPSALERIKNLNGYRLNVEIFAGTFTLSISKKPKNVDDFTGPDASAAKFIREQMNATSLSDS